MRKLSAKVKADILDQPTTTRTDAAMFFNMGRDKFMKRWEYDFRHKIGSVETESGWRLSHVDVIQTAFPWASKKTVAGIMYEHLSYLRNKRVAVKVKRYTDKRDGGEKQ